MSPRRVASDVARTVSALVGGLMIGIGMSVDRGGITPVVIGTALCAPAAIALIRWYVRPETQASFARLNQDRLHGLVNAALVCPHCQTKGQVRTQSYDRKTGVSGTKVVGAVLLGPLSLLATGLSSTEAATQARCDACSSTWIF